MTTGAPPPVRSRAVPEWLELARRVAPKAHGLMLLPPPGAVHPIAQRPN